MLSDCLLRYTAVDCTTRVTIISAHVLSEWSPGAECVRNVRRGDEHNRNTMSPRASADSNEYYASHPKRVLVIAADSSRLLEDPTSTCRAHAVATNKLLQTSGVCIQRAISRESVLIAVRASDRRSALGGANKSSS